MSYIFDLTDVNSKCAAKNEPTGRCHSWASLRHQRNNKAPAIASPLRVSCEVSFY